MLVLSRKEDQKVTFPGLGISVQILRVRGSTVRLGVEAPVEVRIIREELSDGPDPPPLQTHVIRLPQKMRHELRNELNALGIALHLFKEELDAGCVTDAEATFEQLVRHLERVAASGVLSREGVTSTDSAPTALLVEDEPNERELLAGLLRLHGYQVATAADGLEAIEYLETHPKPSLVLVDMRMPRCDGPATVRRIRQNPTFDAMKIFAVSGSTPEENQLDVQQAGISGWFMKPLNPESLVNAMANTLEPSAVAAA